MHDVGFEYPLADWFDFKTPRTSVSPNFIKKSILHKTAKSPKPSARIVWNGPLPLATLEEVQKGKPLAILEFHHKQYQWTLETSPELGQWLVDVLPLLQITDQPVMTWGELEKDFSENAEGNFSAFLDSKEWRGLRGAGVVDFEMIFL